MGCIKLNDLIIKPGEKIKPGLTIDADISPINTKAEVIELPIIFEDDNVIVIDKPSGIISHARGRYWDEASVASFIRARVSALTGERAGIVHRLDRATSGVIICAKNPESLSYLQKQFSLRSVKKHYLALVEGLVEPPKGIINIPIARNPNNPKTFIADPNGKPAQTEFYTKKIINNKTILDLHPLTGRTHQLRVHLSYLKHPIIGDELYGGKKADRLMLHAYSLEITIPGGLRKVFKSSIPIEFELS
jgi:23S rRNA pseudouridine1911/1915/1917 synthase